MSTLNGLPTQYKLGTKTPSNDQGPLPGYPCKGMLCVLPCLNSVYIIYINKIKYLLNKYKYTFHTVLYHRNKQVFYILSYYVQLFISLIQGF